MGTNRGQPYDMVHSPDAIVADVVATARLMVDRLGLIEPREAWLQRSRRHGYEALFARVHPSREVAPTRLEVISAGVHTGTEPEDIPAYIPEVAARQGDRPLKTHATVLTSSSFDELVEGLERRGVRHRVDPPSWDLGHPRLWIGFVAGEGSRYLPDDDAGLMFEVIPTQCLGLPQSVVRGSAPDLGQLPSAAMVRITARSHLVADLDSALKTLEENLGWPAVRVTGASGARRAVMAVNFARSARFELVESRLDEDAFEHATRWGPGPFATRISVRGLDAKAADLSERGTRFRRVDTAEGVPALRVDLDAIPGFLFDFVDDADEPAVPS
jgi:hypothetical protein